MTAAALARTQANLLKGLRARAANYAFVRFASASEGRRWIGEVSRYVRSYEWQLADGGKHRDGSELDQSVLNLAVTKAGLDLLRPGGYRSDEAVRAAHPPPDHVISTPTDAFEQPMRDRLRFLGEDDATWSATDWPTSWRSNLHAVAWISGRDAGQCRRLLHQVDRALGDNKLLRVRAAKLDETNLDSFGFRDGRSQPRIDGVHSAPQVVGGAIQQPTDDNGNARWRGLKPGEFVVGLEDEGGETRRPEPADVLQYATYMVLREIRMYPDRLEKLAEQLAEPYRSTAAAAADPVAEAKAAFVGRRPGETNDDHPDALSQLAPGAVSELDNNDFLYGDDPDGHRCPLGAHIRRSNPRDSLGFLGNITNRHRIIRRGMPYRDAETGQDGLVFIALQARIEDQFEFIQAHWLNSGGTLQVGQNPDLIAGVRARDVPHTTFVRQGRPPQIVTIADPVTTVQGGEYFVLPTLDGLANLARSR